MDDSELKIAALETQIARLDPQLAPLLEPLLLDTLLHLIEVRDREAITQNPAA